MTKITISNISKEIKGNMVLEDISYEMESGKIYGFQGINGSGKTMLMRVMIGLIRPTKGQIVVDGKIVGKDTEFLENVGFLLENPVFLNRYSGFENLEMLASVKGIIGKDEIENVLQLVGLEEAGKKKYRKYSLGMKQRLGIAAAIMESPDILILDEPTNALDEDGVELVKNILKHEKNRGGLVVIACHDLELLKEISDDILVLRGGKMINKR